jgi:hypothetical protein
MRAEQLRGKLLLQVDHLCNEIAMKAVLPPGRRRIDPSFSTAVILAHRNFSRYIYSEERVWQEFSSGVHDAQWEELCSLAAFIWGEGL